ncbi:MAG TPA: ATP-binding protein [Hyphomonadaceae bacterium]|nr:ATP-binding protein [Hyphomonadaceae bacterium]
MTETAGAETEGTRTRGSIARRMLIAAAVWSVVVLAAAGWSLQTLYSSETNRLLDETVDETLTTLTNAVTTADDGTIQYDELKLPRAERFDQGLRGWYWAVIEIGSDNSFTGGRMSKSFVTDRPEVKRSVVADAIQRPAIVHIDGFGPNDEALRVGVRSLKLADRPMPVLLYTGIDRTSADQAVGRFTWQLGIALAVLATGLVVGVVVLIRFGLRPLHEIQDKLHDVRAGRRDTLDGEYPAEMSPLVKEINTLINHNRKVVDRARTHVGNLAHALKNPLAVLMNESRGSDRMSEIVRRQAEAMSANVNHYLKRAQAAAQAEVLGARTEIKEPIEGIGRMLERLHRDKNISVEIEADPKAVFRGEKGDFDELVGNLMDNAAKWCKSRVEVKVTRSDDGVTVIVDDDGPGLPAENRAKALQRGKRLDEREPGTGLGLSIVTELADIYGGRLFLEDSPLGGLRARLELPAAPL